MPPTDRETLRSLNEAELKRRMDLGDEAREELRRRARDREPTVPSPLEAPIVAARTEPLPAALIAEPAPPTTMSSQLRKVDDPRRSTTGGVTPGYEDEPAPGPVGADGQHTSYWVLSEAERSLGFVRPVRRSYKHVGPEGPRHSTRPLTAEERERYAGCDYVLFEEYPKDATDSSVVGTFWTRERLDRVGKGCGSVTTMGASIAETYARDPQFYGSTFCCGCGAHYPVGATGEFVWVVDSVATTERVGT